MPRVTPGFHSIPAIAMLLAIIAVPSCRPDKNPDPATGSGTVTGRGAAAAGEKRPGFGAFIAKLREARCDTREYSAFASDTTNRALRNKIFVSSEYMGENEMHDCQQLISEESLGPLVAILVDTLRVKKGIAENNVFADVFNYDNASYTTLNIEPNLNCLWIKAGTSQDGSDWKAAIRKPNPGAQTCAEGVFGDNPAPGILLTVRRASINGGGAYPSTGRWMWDSVANNQFIGIRCGDAWCEIGKGDFHSTTRITNERSIPGWYDEQRLSYVPSGSTLILSGVIGKITPGVGIENSGQMHSAAGAVVAKLTFAGNDAVAMVSLGRKFGFPPSETTANITFRFKAGSNDAVGEFKGDRDRDWHRIVFINPHTRHAGRRIVRWAWSATDEMAWFPCDVGCCRTEG